MAAKDKKATEKPSEKATKLPAKLEKVVKEIESLSVLELSELVEALQDRLGVSAAPVAQAPAAPAGDGQAAPEGGEQPQAGGAATQTVVLTDAGGNKIAVIKALREINQQLGLKEAKDLAESAPKEVITDVKAQEAQEAKKKLEEAGAQVELK